MISDKFLSLSDELIAGYIQGSLSDKDARTVVEAIGCGEDLWVFGRIAASSGSDRAMEENMLGEGNDRFF